MGLTLSKEEETGMMVSSGVSVVSSVTISALTGAGIMQGLSSQSSEVKIATAIVLIIALVLSTLVAY